MQGWRRCVRQTPNVERPLDEKTSHSICEHMNEDHGDALVAYARALGGLSDVRHARMIALDALGMDLSVETGSGPRTVRIPFDHRLADADDARQTLIAMARER